MLLALVAELLGFPALWSAVVPLVIGGAVVMRGVLKARHHVHPVPAPAEPERIPRYERAWLALGVPTQPFLDHERMTA